jgi:hypothetical protein
VHALRNVHRLLGDGGLVLDLHPIPPSIRVRAEGRDLGPLGARDFFRLVRRVEGELQKTVREGLFELENEVEFEAFERYPSLEDVFEMLEDWEEAHLSKRLLGRMRCSEPPFDFHYHLALRRYRRL